MYKNERVEKLLSAEQIEARVAELGAEISRDYAGESVMLVGTLKGAYILMADLSRKLTIPTQIDFMKVSSYGDATTPSKIKYDHPATEILTGRHVILIEDIVDTGHTLAFLREEIQKQNPASLKVCALLDKPSRREVQLPPCEYIGFTIPDKFVVGYGLDYGQRYRNLPYIGVLIFGGE